jgi:hypothetical protein
MLVVVHVRSDSKLNCIAVGPSDGRIATPPPRSRSPPYWKCCVFEAKRDGQRSLGTWVLRNADDLDRAIQLAYADGILPEMSSAHYSVAPAPVAVVISPDSFPAIGPPEDEYPEDEETEF